MNTADKLAKAGNTAKSVGIGVAVVAGVVVVGYLGYKIYQLSKKAGDAANATLDFIEKTVTESLNPASSKNLANRAFDSLTADSSGTTVGGQVADAVLLIKSWFGPSTPEERAAVVIIDPAGRRQHCQLTLNKYGKVETKECREALGL